ncbi:hypothetical protein [Polaromonas sp. CG9_12]|nr:hypothetical protein [Polaromonas sp. CG9_12]
MAMVTAGKLEIWRDGFMRYFVPEQKMRQIESVYRVIQCVNEECG